MRAGIPNNTFRVCSGGGPRYPSTIAPRRVAREKALCLAFGSTAKACFMASGFIGYFSTSVAIDNGWTGTATLLSYRSGIPAHIFVLPAKPTPER
jgi:hypothetical protein